MSDQPTPKEEPKAAKAPFDQSASELARSKAQAYDADRQRLREEHEQIAR